MTRSHAGPGLRQPAAARAAGADRHHAGPRRRRRHRRNPAARRIAAQPRAAPGAREGRRGRRCPAASCWPPTPWSPWAGASSRRRRPRRRHALPGAAVRPAAPRHHRGRAARPGRAAGRAAGAERRGFRPADRARRSPPTSPAGNGTARPAATPSRAAPRRSSASCRAAIPAWSGCRCSRRRNCCAASAGRCRDCCGILAAPARARCASPWCGMATLLDYAIWRPGAPDGVGDLHRGRVIAAGARDGRRLRGAGRRRGFPAGQRRRRRVTEGDLWRSGSPAPRRAARARG